MKKTIVLIAIVLVPFLTIAQQKPTTIKVNARAFYIDDTPEFKAIISPSNTYSSLPSELTTIDILKKQYRSALEAKGISWSDLKENPNDFGYETMNYGKEGTLYEYRTTSIEKMINFLKVKSLGVNITSYVSVLTIDKAEAIALSQKAINSAKESAKTIAAAMGKELGDIQEIEDLNNRLGEDIETYLYHDKPAAQYIYSLNVVFSVK